MPTPAPIPNREDPRLAVIGLGYGGLPLAATFSLKLPKKGFCINAESIRELEQGQDRTCELSANELENTSVNQGYLERGYLIVIILGRGFAWLDTGTTESVLAAAQCVETIEERQGFKVACLNETAFNNSWPSRAALEKTGMVLSKNGYGQCLMSLLKELA